MRVQTRAVFRCLYAAVGFRCSTPSVGLCRDLKARCLCGPLLSLFSFFVPVSRVSLCTKRKTLIKVEWAGLGKSALLRGKERGIIPPLHAKELLAA